MANRSRGENIIHCCAVRLRVVGEGEFDMTLRSYQGVKSIDLAPLTMVEATDLEPTKQTNFKSQRMQLEFSVDQYNETFQLSRAIFFIKVVASSRPG